MKTFKDLVFKVHGSQNIRATQKFDNGFTITVVAGYAMYSTPRANNNDPNFFSKFEVEVRDDNGRYTREFFSEDISQYDRLSFVEQNDTFLDDVLGWQDRDEIDSIMLLIQSK